MVYTFICKNCGKEYRAKTRRSMYCSESCRREVDKERKRIKYGASREERVCPECGRTFVTKSAASNFCSKKCSQAFLLKKKANKAKLLADLGTELSLSEVFEREKGNCYLCGEKCDFRDIVIRDGVLTPGRKFPTIDYVAQKQSRATAKLAHYHCKGEKR